MDTKIKDMPDKTSSQIDIKARLNARALAVGLDDNATEAKVEAAESKGGKHPDLSPFGLASRARAVGLAENSTELQVRTAEENKHQYPGNTEPYVSELVKRAKALGLSDLASEEQVVKAEALKGVSDSSVKIKDFPQGNREEKERKAELIRRATAVGLSGNATENQLHTAESKRKVKPADLATRAIAVDLNPSSTEAQVLAAEKSKGVYYYEDPIELAKRAKKVGISETSTEAQIVAAELKHPHSTPSHLTPAEVRAAELHR